MHSLGVNCIQSARNLDNARDSYRAVKKDRFAGANHSFEISMVVLRAPLHATSANNVAAFAASRALQKPS